ncbi:hypothetical protein GCM10028857_16040 [Salinarchaeum chitinilyticum]
MHTGSSMDYARLAKGGFLLGAGLFVVGALGELIGHAVFGSLPAWEATLFFDMVVLGVVIGLLSPFVFGIFLPLVD